MERKNNFGAKLERFFNGKGFYIVLFLCIAVIGVSAWIMLFYDGEEDPVSEVSVFNTETISSEPERTPVETLEPSEPEIIEADHKTKPIEPETEGKKAEPTVLPEAEPEVTPVVSTVRAYIWPLSGSVINDYSVDALVYSRTMADWRTHDGIDIAAAVGTKVLAVADGTVTAVYADDMLGTTVVIDHGEGITSIYSNMAGTPTVVAGDKVQLGDVIGAVGSTSLAECLEQGHLHLAMKKDGASIDPHDKLPKKFG